jgi:heptaprenyl diphosphate synthase
MVTVHILASDDPVDSELKELLSAPIKDEEVVAFTLKTLRTHKAMQTSRALLIKYADEAKLLVSDLADGPAKDALISLCDAIITRTS